MTPIASMVAELISRGVDPDVIALAVETAELSMSSVCGNSADKVDAAAERRRARDRERKQQLRGNPRKSADIPQTPNNVLKEEEIEKKEPKKLKARGTRLSADWKPSEGDVKFCLDRQLPPERIAIESEKFRNYWLAKAGAAATKLDWSATWRNWILNNLDRMGGNGNGTGNTPKTGHAGFLAAAARKAERLFGNGDLAGDGNAAEFSRGDGVERGRAEPIDVTPRRNPSGHCRDEPGPGDVREGEIFPPDKNGSGFSDGSQRH